MPGGHEIGVIDDEPAATGATPVGQSRTGLWTSAAIRHPGDSNFDGRFDQLDLVALLQTGKYRTGQPADWSDGDWNGDGVFDQLDLVAALQTNRTLNGFRGWNVDDITITGDEPAATIPLVDDFEGATNWTATDATPPVITISTPGRGEFVSGASMIEVTGTVEDAGSGIARVEMNGQPASLDGSRWFISTSLRFGINTFQVQAIDRSGNVARTSWSALYSPTYLPADQFVANGAASRLDPTAVQTLSPLVAGAVDRALADLQGRAVGPFRLSVSNDPPIVTLSPVENGLRAVIDIPNLELSATIGTFALQISATNVQIDVELVISLTNHEFTVTMPTTPAVALTGFSSSPIRLPQAVVKSALEFAIQTTLPPAVGTALNDAMGPHTVTFGGVTATLDYRPTALAIDPANFWTRYDVCFTAPAAPSVTLGPGSPVRGPSAPPDLDSAHDVSHAISESFLNRALYSAWAAGPPEILIDEQFLADSGIVLPFPLDASFLVPFFPALASLGAGSRPMPLALEVQPLLPPVVEVTGAPALLSSSIGEVHLGVLIDFGQGWVHALTLVAHAEMQTDALDGLQLTLGTPTRVVGDILDNPLGLQPVNVDTLLDQLVPQVVSILGSQIPPIPLPPLPPISLVNPQIGEHGGYLVVEGDVSTP